MTLTDLKISVNGNAYVEDNHMYVEDKDGFIYQVADINGDILTVTDDNGKKIDFNLSDVKLIV